MRNWMLRLRHAVAATAVLACLCAAPAASAVEPDEASRAQARDALAEAEDLIEGRGARTGRELTPVLLELARSLGALPPGERSEARDLLARPTDTATDPPGTTKYTVAEATPVCTAHFCIHYVAATADAPDLTDGDDSNGTPDYVDLMAATFEFGVYPREVTELGWRPPKPDGTRGGGLDKTDVYIKDLGPGLYGYAATDPGQASATAFAYQVMDDDYVSFAPTPEGRTRALQVTAAHEFNHVLQFGYDRLEDPWMFEATATWMEDKVYDSIDDYRQYLPGWAAATEQPLTCPNDNDAAEPDTLPNCPARAKFYGSAVWSQWLDGERGEATPRVAWERSLAANSFAHFAYARALTDATDDASLAAAFGDAFAAFSAETAEWRVPGSNWEEGSSYPDVERQSEALTPAAGAPSAVTLDHTTFAHFNVTGTGAEPITLQATLPAGLRGAIALVGRTGTDPAGGTVTVRLASLPNGGAGSVTLEQPSSFGRITAVLVNADVSNTGYDGARDDYLWTRDDQPASARVFSGTPPAPPPPPPPPPDLTPPETTITSGPSSITADPSVSLSFNASEEGSGFTCRLNGVETPGCTSPFTAGPLPDGSYQFEVSATDSAGNSDLTPAISVFSVDTRDLIAPAAPRVRAQATQSVRTGRLLLLCTSTETGTCSTSATVRVPYPGPRKGGRLYRLKVVRRSVTANRQRRIELVIPRGALKAVRLALRRRERLIAVTRTVARDAAGNVSPTRRLSIGLRR